MKTTKHTPTPWRLVPPNRKKRPSDILHNQTILLMGRDGSEFRIATIEGPGNIDMFHTWKANGEFLVRACNAHEAMAEALQAVVVLYDQGQLVIDGDNENGRDPVIEAARAALAAAGVTP